MFFNENGGKYLKKEKTQPVEEKKNGEGKGGKYLEKEKVMTDEQTNKNRNKIGPLRGNKVPSSFGKLTSAPAMCQVWNELKVETEKLPRLLLRSSWRGRKYLPEIPPPLLFPTRPTWPLKRMFLLKGAQWLQMCYILRKKLYVCKIDKGRHPFWSYQILRKAWLNLPFPQYTCTFSLKGKNIPACKTNITTTAFFS